MEEKMKSKIEWDRMIGQKLYNPAKVGDNSWEKVHKAQKRFNDSEFWEDTSALEELKKCFAKAPDDMVLTPPVYFDHGDRVAFGKNVVIGSGSVVTKNIPDNTIAAGNPCKVIREINESDKEKWESEYRDYLSDIEKNKV